jgi:hypothetical protein
MRLLALVLLACSLFGAVSYRLYLKDGTSHRVREHRVEGDRVKFYALEREDWEEIPVSLVDLAKTEKELQSRVSAAKEQEALVAAEDRSARQDRRESAAIPNEWGLYRLENGTAARWDTSEIKTKNDKARSALKAVVPVFAGKAKIEIPGTASKRILSEPQPEFYLVQDTPRPFVFVRIKPQKDTRLVDSWTIEPATGMVIERKLDQVDAFRQELREGVFKFWPLKPLAPGEYAVVEFIEESATEIKIWDFAITR